MWINVDDYGMCNAVDKAVVDLFDKKIIQSTSVMSTCASSGSLRLLKMLNSKGLKVGIHLDLTDGTPLSSKFKKQYSESFPTFQEWIRKDIVIKQNAIVEEWIAQISRIQDAGILVNHIDFHRAYPFTDPRLWWHYVSLAKELKLPYRGSIMPYSKQGILLNSNTLTIMSGLFLSPLTTIHHFAPSLKLRQKGSYESTFELYHNAGNGQKVLQKLRKQKFKGEIVSHAMVDTGESCVDGWKVKEYEVLVSSRF